MTVPAVTADLYSTADREPFDFLAGLREKSAVVWDDALQGWLVLDHDLCKSIFTNESLFAHNYAFVDDDTLEIKGGNNLVVIQGPLHHKLHRWAVQLFSQKNMQGYVDDHIRPVVDRIFDGFQGRTSADLRTELCNHVPGRSMMSMMGMERADDDFVQHVVNLHERIMTFLGMTSRNASPQIIADAKAASQELNEILLPVIRERRENPGTDLLSRLWIDARGILEEFDEDLMLANARELFLGGFDTTVHALSNGIYILLTNPEVRTILQNDRGERFDTFLEEVVRVYGVVQHRTRIAMQETELAGVTIRQGDPVIPVLLAANRDPARYGACPWKVNLDQAKPREHLAYIAGPRSCPGAPLARAEMRLVFESLLDRLQNVRLDPDAEASRFVGGYTRSWRPLNVRFDTAL